MSDQSDSSNSESFDRSDDDIEEPNFDDSNQPAHQSEKPQKLRAKYFIEDRAEDDVEGSDSYEEDYYDDEENEEDRNFVNDDEIEDDTSFSSYLKYDQKRKKKGKSKGKKRKSLKEKSKEIQDRFSGYVDRDVYEYIPDQKALKTGILQWRASLVPSVGDNRLFLIHTRPGREYKVLLNLLKKYYPGGDVSMINQQFSTVFAAFCSNQGSGYVYVEAMTSAEVKVFQADIPDVMTYMDIIPIPYSDGPGTIQVPHKNILIFPGNFVRIKNDLKNESYKNDLAQVININRNNDTVILKLVPRIDYSQLQEIHDNAQNEDQDDSTTFSLDNVDGSQIKLNQIKGLKKYRPPQAEFNEDKVKNLCSSGNMPERSHKTRYWKIKFDDPNYKIQYAVKWDGSLYIGSFAYKEYPINYITYQNVKPLHEEVKRFIDGLQPNDFEYHIPGFKEHMNNSLGKPESNNFNIHNIVRIIEGEYKGLIVEIKSIQKENITVVPVEKEYEGTEITVSIDMIKKFFTEGDHVKILYGQYAGYTGEVQVTQDDYACILLDSNNQTVEVNMEQLISSSDVFSEPRSYGKYSLYDLVQLNDRSEGVIWKIENKMLFVLLTNGESRQISIDNIDHKINDRTRTARDKRGGIICIEQMVTPPGGVKAVVKHISKNILYLQSDKNREYNGLLISEAQKCQVDSNQNTRHSPSHVSSGKAKFHSLTNTEFKIGQTIIIKTGRMKGQLGDIKEIDQLSIRVLIHLKNNFKNFLLSDRGKKWDTFNKSDKKSSFDSIFDPNRSVSNNNDNFNNNNNNNNNPPPPSSFSYNNPPNNYYTTPYGNSGGYTQNYPPYAGGYSNNQGYTNRYGGGYGQSDYHSQGYGNNPSDGYSGQQRYNN